MGSHRTVNVRKCAEQKALESCALNDDAHMAVPNDAPV